MTKSSAVIHSFNAGEASYSALARVDQETIRLVAERQENLLPYAVGKAIMRPGTALLGTTNQTARLIPFLRSIDTTALLEIGAGNTLRVYVNDAIVTRPAVTCSISDPTFATGSGWTTTTTGGASATTAGSLVMSAPAAGGLAVCKQTVTTSSANTLHALRIVIDGYHPVTFCCGSADDASDYVSTTSLYPGQHSLAFTPTAGSFYIKFQTTSSVNVTVTSCTIESAGPLSLPTPWGSSNIADIRYAQSLDVIFVAADGIAPYKIEHRPNDSWSVTEYYTDDGPFTLAATAEGVKLTPTATYGNTTISSNVPFFSSAQVGTILQLTHDSMAATYKIGAATYATQAFRVTGVWTGSNVDRNFSATISGTWAGTIRVQRSFNGQLSGFGDYPTAGDITANGTVNVSDAQDNAIIWYRLIFSSYTSGSATISITYGSYGFSGICRITGVNSSTSANIEVVRPLANTLATGNWLEGEWSASRGYPSAVALFDGRLWWARDDKFWASVSDNYYSYATATSVTATQDGIPTTVDSSSIQRNISTGGDYDQVVWMLPLQRLLFGTSGAEISARSGAIDQPLTPTDVTLKTTSSQGSAAISPIKIDKRGLYVQRSTHKLYALSYDAYQQDYLPENLTRLNEEIGHPADTTYTDGFTQIAVQRQPETYVWCVRSDGIVCCLLYEPTEKVQGWFRVMTGGNDGVDRILSVAVIPQQNEDAVYFLVYRDGTTSGGSATYCIERLDWHRSILQYSTNAGNFPDIYSTDNVAGQYPQASPGINLVDSWVQATASPLTLLTVSGLSHLNGRSVMALGYSVANQTYGPLQNDAGGYYHTVSAGSITLGEYANGTVRVGLPYKGSYKSAKLAYGAPQGSTALLRPKKVNLAGLLMQDTHPDAIKIGSEFDGIETMDALPRIEDLQPVDTTGNLQRQYDKRMFPFANVWNTDARVCIEVQPGYPATLNGIVLDIETG